MDSKKALEVILKGNVTTIDCCKANERVFFCTCGVGFDAAVSQKFANEKRRGSLTYIKDTIEEYLSYKPPPYELLVDNQTIKEKAFLVACGNASQYGNNAFIAPHANIQDGMMDLTILSPFTPLDIAPLAIQLFTKQIDRNSKIMTMKAKQVTIIRQQDGVMHLDGEPVMADATININIIPAALKVFTPEVISFSREVHNLFGEVTRFFDKRLPYIFK
jgi:diacylglycerol kinase family enzyme